MESSEPEAAGRRVAAFLRAQILGGQILPGERIRQEEVAVRLGTSRLPVREALRILEAEGLAEHALNKGARVPLLTMHEVDVLYQIRERIEPLALVEGLDLLTPEHLDELADLERRIEESGDDVGEFLALDREFHLLTYSTCHHETLQSMIVRNWNSTQHYRRAFMTITGRGQRWVVHAEHNLLLDALRRRDRVDAERYLQGHIRRTRIELSNRRDVFSPRVTS